MATINERVAANETNIRMLSRRQDNLEKKVDQINSWKEQTVGAAREAARYAAIRFTLAGLVLTAVNIGVTLYLHHH